MKREQFPSSRIELMRPYIAEVAAEQVTTHDRSQWFGDDHADRAIAMPTNQLVQHGFNASERRVEHFAFRRTNADGIVLELFVNAWLESSNFVDQLTLPQPMIDITEALNGA